MFQHCHPVITFCGCCHAFTPISLSDATEMGGVDRYFLATVAKAEYFCLRFSGILKLWVHQGNQISFQKSFPQIVRCSCRCFSQYFHSIFTAIPNTSFLTANVTTTALMFCIIINIHKLQLWLVFNVFITGFLWSFLISYTQMVRVFVQQTWLLLPQMQP